MIRTDRLALAGGLAVALLPGTFMLATPAAQAELLPELGTTIVESHANKAQVEYRERLQNKDPSPIAGHRSEAYADYKDRQSPRSRHRSKAQIEHDEQMAGESRPVVPGNQPVPAGGNDGVTAWQLALSTLAGAVAGGGVAAGARRFRRQPAGAVH